MEGSSPNPAWSGIEPSKKGEWCTYRRNTSYTTLHKYVDAIEYMASVYPEIYGALNSIKRGSLRDTHRWKIGVILALGALVVTAFLGNSGHYGVSIPHLPSC